MTADSVVPPDQSHVVSPDDERRHTPDAEDLWNESYYCDFVTADGSLGGWLRLGLYPNRDVAWWTTWILRPGQPGICSVDYGAPIPPGSSLVSESPTGGRIEIELLEALSRFRLAATVPGRVIADPADVYTRPDAEQSGTPASLDLDLTWRTDGVPFHYVATTRYEIPCTVEGRVTVDGETVDVRGQGQRDHSWGVRDWWAFGWCWCSMRLDDGTRIHLADIRMFPDIPVFFGYIQTGGTVHPATAVSVSEDLGDHGLPTRARIDIAAGSDAAAVSLGLDVTPTAFGPVLLRDEHDESGARSSRFPRAMVTCRTDDGRTGAGWIEWNQPAPVASSPT